MCTVLILTWSSTGLYQGQCDSKWTVFNGWCLRLSTGEGVKRQPESDKILQGDGIGKNVVPLRLPDKDVPDKTLTKT